MRNLTFDNLTETVVKAYDGTADPRLKQILGVLIPKLHDFVREVELTPQEWEGAMGFLYRAAKITDEQRNEFILLSDLLGVSALVDLMAGLQAPGASVTSLLGPFYAPGTPELSSGADLIKDNPGERLVVSGPVSNTDGTPLGGATLEIWQNADNGLYVVQDPTQADDNLRCTLRADQQGNYSFSTIKPISYEVPGDGAGGELLRAGGRHCWRPAHIHLVVGAPGYQRHISEVFDVADRYIDQDSVFGVRAPLSVPFDREPTEQELARFAHVERPFHMVDKDFVLAKAE